MYIFLTVRNDIKPVTNSILPGLAFRSISKEQDKVKVLNESDVLLLIIPVI